MIGLPKRIRCFGTVPVNEFIAVAKGCRSLMRQCRQRRVEPAHNGVDGCVRRRGDLALCRDFCDLTINRRNREARFAQRQPFDQRRQIPRQLAPSRIVAGGTDETSQPFGAIAFQPAAHRAKGDTGKTRGARKRNIVFKMRLKDGEPRHGFLALLL